MKIVDSSIIYENSLPQLRSRQSFFPFLCELPDGKLAAVHVIGEAFESVDSTSYISFSDDGGKNWSTPHRLFNKQDFDCPITDYCKVSVLPDGRLAAIGYAYYRRDTELPIGNPKNGGVLDDFVFYSTSSDNGMTWEKIRPIECVWGPHVEASAPLTVLSENTFITPITGFPDWNGNITSRYCGRVLRSDDGGKTWDDSTVCMEFDGDITCYEQRMCRLESGAIVCIGWNENIITGERLNNHYTISYDGGRSFSKPISTGIQGQASSVCALGGDYLLALHAVRRDTDRPGIYGCIVDLSNRKWNIVEKTVLWEPSVPIVKDKNMAEIFSFLKFGQPGAILLSSGDIMMSHWYAENGQYRTAASRIKL